MASNRPAPFAPGDPQPPRSFPAQSFPTQSFPPVADGPYGGPQYPEYAAGPGRPYFSPQSGAAPAPGARPEPGLAPGHPAPWQTSLGATGEFPLPHASGETFLPPGAPKAHLSAYYATGEVPLPHATGEVPLPGGWQPTPPRATWAPGDSRDRRGTHSFGTEGPGFDGAAVHDAVAGDYGTRTFDVHDIAATDLTAADLASGDAGSTHEFALPDIDAEGDFGDVRDLAYGEDRGYGEASPYGGSRPGDDFFGGADAGAPEDEGAEWNPTADSVRPVRGRHRVMKQRGGLARSSTVLGVGVIAAVGAGGIASAEGGKPAVHIAMPDLSSVAHALPDEARSLPGVGHLIPGGASGPDADAAPLSGAGVTTEEAEHGTTDAGEALRERIMQQAEQQQDQAETAVERAAEEAAAKQAADEAAQQKEAAEKKAAAEKKKAEEAAKRKAEAERLAKLAKSFTLPVASYTITAGFGDGGSMWSSGYHTGLDFAAPTGTLLKSIHNATVKEAGWNGSYGYRTVLELDDGTELWYCHQSSIGVSVGQKVSTGQVIGRVGATGNVTGPHLHLEVHPGGGAAIDPLPWLHKEGLTP